MSDECVYRAECSRCRKRIESGGALSFGGNPLTLKEVLCNECADPRPLAKVIDLDSRRPKRVRVPATFLITREEMRESIARQGLDAFAPERMEPAYGDPDAFKPKEPA